MTLQRQKMVVCFALAIGTLIAYWPVRGYDFINYDDPDYVSANPHVQAGLTPSGLKWAFTTGYAGNWHPLTWISHMLDTEAFGVNPGADHLINVAFHLANAILLFLVLMDMTDAMWRSAFVAGLFAWHPLHVESVAWIAERKDVLSAFLGLLSLWLYVRFVKTGQQRNLAYALVVFALALLAKPMLVTLPFVFLLLDYWPLHRDGLRIWEKVPFFVLTAASSVITYLVQRKVGAVASLAGVSIPYRLGNAVLAYCSYLGKMFWPTKLSIIYPLTSSNSGPVVGGAFALFVGISAAVIYWRRTYPWLAVGWFWFVGMLVPAIGIVQVGSQTMADRYTYLPLVGVFIMVAWSVTNSTVTFAAAAVALSGCLIVASMQVRYWRNTETLFAHAVAVTKDNYVAETVLGGALVARGQLSEAEAHFREALRIYPQWADAQFSLAAALAQQGKTDEAIVLYQRYLSMRADPNGHFNLGNLFMRLGRVDDAIAQFAEAARLNPQMADAQNNWGYALTKKGDLREAERHYQAAVDLDPNFTQARMNVARIRQELANAR